MIHGVDVHPDYQRGLNMATLFDQGYRFCSIKHSQGTGYTHSLSDDWVRAARAAGLIPGAYHWLNNVDGARQAELFYRQVRQSGGPRGMLIQLDCEDNGYGPHMAAWAKRWRELSDDHPFIIYTGSWWWPRTGNYRGASLTPYLWHSHYLAADTDSVPDNPRVYERQIPASWWTPGYGGWKTATFLQYTSRGDAGKLANNVDLNATRLSMDELRGLAGLGTVGAPGPVDSEIRPIPDTKPSPTPPPAPQQGEDEVLRIINKQGTDKYWVTNGVWRTGFAKSDLDTVQWILRTHFGMTAAQVVPLDPARDDLFGRDTATVGASVDLMEAIRSMAARQQIDAYRIDAVLFDRPKTVGPGGSEYEGQDNGLHATLKTLRTQAGLSDVQVEQLLTAVRQAVIEGVGALLSGAEMDVKGTLELISPPTQT